MTTTTLSNSATVAEIAAVADDRPRGWQGLPCLYCQETDCVSLDLSDMTGDAALKCGQCETEFSLADVRAKLAAWAPVLAWCALVPEVK